MDRDPVTEDIGAFAQRGWEWELYCPLVGSSMLELGNKKKGDFVYKAFFQSRGFRHVSIDWNGQDGALKKDLRKPLKLGTFDMVTNIGTSEHVSEKDYNGQVGCWRNLMEAMHVGSVLISITPKPGSWPRHGVWYPTEEFFHELARLNGCGVERVYSSDTRWKPAPDGYKYNFARLVRRELAPFVMPDQRLMYRNERQ
jgi:hypothetical protein